MAETLTTTRYQPAAWDLSDLIPPPLEESTAQRLAALSQAVTELEASRERLHPAMDPGELAGILRRYEAVIEEIRILSSHGVLWVSADTRSREAQAHRSRVQQALTGLHNRILFVELWWKSLSAGQAEALLTGAEIQRDDRCFLSRLRQTTPFTLDERSEQIINRKDNSGGKFLVSLWSMLNNRLQFRVEVDGEVRSLSRAEAMGFAFSSRPEHRAAAYRELNRVYEEEAGVLGQIYAHLMRDWHQEKVGLRGYRSPIAARNVANDLPDEVVEVLLRSVRDHAGLFHRYFRLKARWLGAGRLHRYDLYAPLSASEREIPFSEAVDLILSTFASFSPAFGQAAERVFAEGHVDSLPRAGKWSGDFCSTVVPRLTPWVLVSYNGRLRDVLTLAHELGHAIHSVLASGHSVLTQVPSLVLGETASVFCETLVADRLLQQEDDPRVRRELLATSVDGIYAAIVRQAYLVLFELDAHDALHRGAGLPELGDIYKTWLREQFGDSVEGTDDFRFEWLGIHQIFHSPFYPYAYSFGQLLTLSLYRRSQEQGEAFLPDYLKLLSYGGAARPMEILAEAGIDPATPAFWESGFRVIEHRIAELEALEG